MKLMLQYLILGIVIIVIAGVSAALIIGMYA